MTKKPKKPEESITNQSVEHDYCPVNTTLELIGGKWKVLILYQLLNGERRFNELRRLMPTITQRMLTLQLRQLEDTGLILRKVYDVIPPKVEYSLSDFGKTLFPVINAMHSWGVEYKKHCQVILPMLEIGKELRSIKK